MGRALKETCRENVIKRVASDQKAEKNVYHSFSRRSILDQVLKRRAAANKVRKTGIGILAQHRGFNNV